MYVNIYIRSFRYIYIITLPSLGSTSKGSRYGDNSDPLDKSKSRKKSLTRKFDRSDSRLLADEELLPKDTMEDAGEPGTEDYWFICKRWLARSEDDGKIVRELIATDEYGKPLEGGLQGKANNSCFASICCSVCYFVECSFLVWQNCKHR